MQKVLFLPGFPEDITSRNYSALLDMIRHKNYDPIFVNLKWRNMTQDDWARHLDQVRTEHGYDAVLAGFSFGAVAALMSAATKNPAQLWLFSLSPFFTEDADTWSASDRTILGKRRIEAACRTPFAQLAPRVRCPVELFLGEQESVSWPEMGVAFERAISLLPSAKGHLIQDVGHAVDDPRYIEAIERAIPQSR